MDGLLFEFDKFPKEHSLIADMVLAYGEIEFILVYCISQVLDDPNTGARVWHRVRGEGARLEVADAILRPAYRKVDLEGKWGVAIGAAKHCKNIRNLYAHCHWHISEDERSLQFTNLDAEVGSSSETLSVTVIPVHLDVVQQQHKYFRYALNCLYHLASIYPPTVGKQSQISGFPEMKSIPAPLLYRKSS